MQWGDARHGVGAIVLSWVLSPVIAALFASALFLATKYGVLLASDSHARCTRPAPLHARVLTSTDAPRRRRRQHTADAQ